MPRRQKTVEERLAEIVREIGPQSTKQILAMLIALYPPMLPDENVREGNDDKVPFMRKYPGPPKKSLATACAPRQEPPGSEPQRKAIVPV